MNTIKIGRSPGLSLKLRVYQSLYTLKSSLVVCYCEQGFLDLMILLTSCIQSEVNNIEIQFICLCFARPNLPQVCLRAVGAEKAMHLARSEIHILHLCTVLEGQWQ